MMKISCLDETMFLRCIMCRSVHSEWNFSKYISWGWCIILLLASVFRIGISSVKADVRCFCNLPECIPQGYMCKSSSGICISQRSKGTRMSNWTKHMCIELLARWSKTTDYNQLCPKQKKRESNTDIFCCHEDMCNYLHSEEMNRQLINNHSAEHLLTLQEKDGKLSPHQRRLWLKSAVISVPVAGGCVLVLLIVVATKLLRTDVKSQECKVKPFPCSEDKLQLSSNARILPKSYSSIVVMTKPTLTSRNCVSSASINALQQTVLYRNVPVTTSTDTSCTDSSRDKYFVFDV